MTGGPSLLLVDEPTAALDRQRAHEIVQLLIADCHELGVASAAGAASAMVTHDLEVIDHCDRVFQMVDGHLTLRGMTVRSCLGLQNLQLSNTARPTIAEVAAEVGLARSSVYVYVAGEHGDPTSPGSHPRLVG